MAHQVVRHCMQSPNGADPAPSNAYMTVELMGAGLYDTTTHASLDQSQMCVSNMSSSTINVGAGTACFDTCSLLCNDSISPTGSWYKVRVYTGGRLGTDGKPTAGRLVETWKLVLSCATTTYPTPTYLRDVATRLEVTECSTC